MGHTDQRMKRSEEEVKEEEEEEEQQQQQQQQQEEQEQEEQEEVENVPSCDLSQPLFSVFESEVGECCCVDGLEVGLVSSSSSPVVDFPNAVQQASVASSHETYSCVDVPIYECFEFVSASGACLDCEEAAVAGRLERDDIDVSECLDFMQEAEKSECLDSSPKGGGEGDGSSRRRRSGVDGEVISRQCMDLCKSESLDSFDAQGCVDVLEVASESLDSGVVHQSAQEEASLLPEVTKSTTTAGEVASGSESGECSSGDKKEEHSNRKGGSKNATASGGKKKAKVDWTPELHRRFVQAVEQLGVEKAFPSRILELMGVQCLTRHNIASHLQKYRSHRRHLAAREAEAASWSHNRGAYTHPSWNRSRRTDGLPYLLPVHSNSPPIKPRPSSVQPHLASHAHHQMPQPPLTTPLKVWGYPTLDHSSLHMWQQLPVSPPSFWQAPDGSYWQHPAACYDACHPAQAPTCYPHPMRVPLATMPSSTANHLVQGSSENSFFADEALPASMYLCNSYESDIIGTAAGAAACSTPPSESQLSKEILDAAIREALANPWTPPPLGLKPPSMEGVIAELQRQGINTVSPSSC